MITVLLVDSDKGFCNIVSCFFKEHSEVELVGIAHDGSIALDMCMEKKPDVLVLGIVLPEIDGIGVLERLNTQKKQGMIPLCIVISEILQEKIIRMAFDLGVKYYIAKPRHSNLRNSFK